jgi:hypothetical protein
VLGTGWDQPGAGLAVQPNAMRALACLGAGAAVERAGVVISRFGYYDQHGDPLCDIDLAGLWSAVGPFVGISRAAPHDVLRSGPDRCRLGLAVTSVAQDGQRVPVSFGDATAAEYDLVVGADGINSDVRRLAFGGPMPAYAGQMAWRSLAPRGGCANTSRGSASRYGSTWRLCRGTATSTARPWNGCPRWPGPLGGWCSLATPPPGQLGARAEPGPDRAGAPARPYPRPWPARARRQRLHDRYRPLITPP